MTRAEWVGFTAMCVGMFMTILDIQIVAAALPGISQALGIPLDRLSSLDTQSLAHQGVRATTEDRTSPRRANHRSEVEGSRFGRTRRVFHSFLTSYNDHDATSLLIGVLVMHHSSKVVAAVVALSACATLASATLARSATAANSTTAPADSRQYFDEFADWPSYNRDLQNDRFAPLASIWRGNVHALHPVCTAIVDADIGFETGPIVIHGVLYATTIHATYAFDAANCKRLWVTSTGHPADSGLTNRGAAYGNGKIFRGTISNHVLALDARSGKLLWDQQVSVAPANISAAPIVWRGVVYIGLGGGDNGSKGGIFALDAETGRVLWSAPTVPADPLSGLLPNSSGWGGAAHVAGGSTWSSYTIDPFRGLLLVSTGNPAPDFFGAARLGENRSTDSLLVYNAVNGKLLDQHQFVPHDTHDWDIAASAAYFAPTATAFIGGKDGLLRRVQLGNPSAIWTTKVTTVDDSPAQPIPGMAVHFCPGTTGGVEWNAPAYSPAQNAVFVNSVDWCNTLSLPKDVTAANINNSNFAKPPVFVVPGSPWTGAIDYASKSPLAPFGVPDTTETGHATAVDARTGRVLWRYNASSPMLAGITPTASGLIFTADLNGHFFAFDARSGALLKQIALHEPTAGGVITYLAHGKQFVAVATGMTSPQVWHTAGTNAIVVLGL